MMQEGIVYTTDVVLGGILAFLVICVGGGCLFDVIAPAKMKAFIYGWSEGDVFFDSLARRTEREGIVWRESDRGQTLLAEIDGSEYAVTTCGLYRKIAGNFTPITATNGNSRDYDNALDVRAAAELVWDKQRKAGRKGFV